MRWPTPRAAGRQPGDTLAVYDVGGGRFDAAVLRRGDPRGIARAGRPEGLADVGGLDVDELVWQHVRAGLPDDVQPDARVRRACTRAKETLSTSPRSSCGSGGESSAVRPDGARARSRG